MVITTKLRLVLFVTIIPPPPPDISGSVFYNSKEVVWLLKPPKNWFDFRHWPRTSLGRKAVSDIFEQTH